MGVPADAGLYLGLSLAKTRKPNKVEVYTAKHEGKLSRAILAVMVTWRKKVARKVKRMLDDFRKDASEEQKFVDRVLRQIQMQGFSVDLVDEITPELRQAFKSAGLSAIAEVNVEASAGISAKVNAAADQFVKDRGAELVTQIEETTRERLRALITTSLAEGQSAQDLANAIEESAPFGEARAMTIARTELAFAHVNGNLDGYRQSGVVDKKQWVTGAGCCDDCLELDGVEVGLDDTFNYADGPVDGPPAHPNCRCDAIPVLADTGEEE